MTSYNFQATGFSTVFQTTTYGKCILAGEHAVLRGHGALVFPVHEKTLTLSYHRSTSELHAEYEGESGADMHLLFWSVLEQGMQLIGKSLNSLHGCFHVYCDIPIGVGLGASAALSVAVARWFSAQNLLPKMEIYAFAKQLENLFHGTSSGLDIAGVATTAGIYFCQGEIKPLQQSWSPHLYLSSCGQIGITSHCIQQVQKKWQENPEMAAQIDKQMAYAVLEARKALAQEKPIAKAQLAEALNIAALCFEQWGLVSDSLLHHMHHLKAAGAIAVKPTGSGGGGYVVSLWDDAPPPVDGLIALFPGAAAIPLTRP